MTWGSDWKRLIVAVNHSVPEATSTFVGAEGYYIGLCQGTANTYKSTATDEWVGGWIGDVGTSWNYLAGPPAVLRTGGGAYPSVGYKQGSTRTHAGGASLLNYVGVSVRSYWTLAIEHTVTGYAARMYNTATSPSSDKFGREFELLACQTDYAPDIAINFATNRRLDTLSIYWGTPSVGLEISELLVVRMA